MQNIKPCDYQTLREVFEQMYIPHKLAGASDSTCRQYRASLKNFDLFLASIGINRPAEICDLRDDLVHRVAYWLVKERKCRPHSALKLQENLLAIWRFLVSRHFILDSPDVKMINVPKLIPTAWTKEQLRTLWQACQKQEGEYSGIPCSLWWHALHSVIWDTGERISAVMQCRWTDLDLEGGYLHVQAEYRKGKTEDRLFRLHPDTVSLLDRMRNTVNGPIFPPPRGKVTNLWNHYKALLRGAGLPDDRSHMFHCLRRSTASWLEVAGGDATEQLGHSSREITKKYLDPRIVQKKQAADFLFRPLAAEVE